MANPTEHRRLLAILIADIVGYSSLMARFETETFLRVQELQTSLIVPTVARNKGEVVKYTGDGFIATFASALDAVRAAVELQSGAKAAAATASEDRRIRFRIGINVGDVIVVPGDVYGDSVNIAARLQALATPDGICVSRAVRDTVKGKFEIDFSDLGDVEVKNIPDPVGIYALKFQALAWTMDRKVSEPIGKPPGDRRLLPLATGGGVAAAAAAVAAWFLAGPGVRPPPAPVAPTRQPAQLLNERLARIAPAISETARAEIVAGYLQASPARALAVDPSSGRTGRATGYEAPSRAEERALETCQIRSGLPCTIAAVDDALAPAAAPPWPLRDMPRVTYTGLFEPAQLPTPSQTRARADVVAYRGAPAPKAAAIHASGQLHLVAGADSQHAAERRALDACNEDPVRLSRDVPCFIYAVGNQVVLPRRATDPVTPILATPQPPPVAAPATSRPAHPPAAVAQAPASAPPAPAAQVPRSAKERISAAIAARAPGIADTRRNEIVDLYLAEKPMRAIAVAVGRSATWRVGGHSVASVAEERALEGCMINYGEPCAVVAVDETLVEREARPAPRVVYAGLFDPAQAPVSPSVRTRADVLAYRSASGPKAAAIHPWGVLHIVTDAANQRDAETKALAACTADPIHRGRDMPCYLYAVGNQVVLPRRASSPITP
jgi:class 3 adenylate cyclase